MENIKIFTKLISTELHLQEHAVENTLKLLDEGCTIPFISRYRKERTGGLDEVQITSISNRLEQLQEIAKRKETIIKTITEQQKMTPELQKRIDDCWESTVLSCCCCSVSKTPSVPPSALCAMVWPSRIV